MTRNISTNMVNHRKSLEVDPPQWFIKYMEEFKKTIISRLDHLETKHDDGTTNVLELQTYQLSLKKIVLDEVNGNSNYSINNNQYTLLDSLTNRTSGSFTTDGDDVQEAETNGGIFSGAEDKEIESSSDVGDSNSDTTLSDSCEITNERRDFLNPKYDDSISIRDREVIEKIRNLVSEISLRNWVPVKTEILDLSISTKQASMEIVDIFMEKISKESGKISFILSDILLEFSNLHLGIVKLHEMMMVHFIGTLSLPIPDDIKVSLTSFVTTYLPNDFKYVCMMNMVNAAKTELELEVLKFLVKEIPGIHSVRYLRQNLHLSYYMKNSDVMSSSFP